MLAEALLAGDQQGPRDMVAVPTRLARAERGCALIVFALDLRTQLVLQRQRFGRPRALPERAIDKVKRLALASLLQAQQGEEMQGFESGGLFGERGRQRELRLGKPPGMQKIQPTLQARVTHRVRLSRVAE